MGGGQMRKPILLLGPAILAIVVPALVLTAGSSRAEPAADDCLAKPNSTSPEGRHWYYRIDRASKRRCWYLGPKGQEVRADSSTKRARLSRAVSPKPLPSVQPVAEATTSVKLVAQAIAETPAEPTIEPAAAHAVDTAAAFARRWSDLSASASSPDLSAQVEAELAQARARAQSLPARQAVDARARRGDDGGSTGREQGLRTAYAPEPSTTHSEDDMPLIWPVLSAADRQLAEQPQATAIKLVLAFVAGALGVTAVFGCAIFKLYPARPDRRRRTPKRWSPWARSICRRQQIPPTCAQVFAARGPAERAGELVAAMRRAGRAQTTLAPGERTEEIEESRLPRWLERRRVAA
jgi:hypothetical protein